MMNVKTIALAGSILAATATTSTNAEIIDFFPSGDNKTTIKIKNNEVEIVNGDKLEKKIEFDTEKTLNIEIYDYDFDKNLDFSIWHSDDGKGVYDIYRIFLYNKKTKTFVEAQSKCGDEFINVKIDKKTKAIASTIFEDNTPKTCHTKL
ncbi:XAC2610-related protein [Pseudomonas sp. Pseusp97]|uniref:XAC2610-related protein n=1 Tax=Pseudomonas sp. Pseusp97 TaxID=3243065 RepID=UPI0039A746EE